MPFEPAFEMQATSKGLPKPWPRWLGSKPMPSLPQWASAGAQCGNMSAQPTTRSPSSATNCAASLVTLSWMKASMRLSGRASVWAR